METNSSDEKDLVKALDGVDEAVASLSKPVSNPLPDPEPKTSDLAFEETSTPGSEPVVLPGSPVAPATPADDVTPSISAPVADDDKPAPAANPELEAIKKDALLELRPLVNKLAVSPEELFDTYLLLIRSTDDESLIAAAHDAAKEIPDETRRAEALLDVIKEIDYLSQQKKAA